MMNNNMNNIEKIPQEKFEFVQLDARLTDKKLDTKARGYFADAMLRFSKNKSSVVAAYILLFLVLFAIIAPMVGMLGVNPYLAALALCLTTMCPSYLNDSYFHVVTNFSGMDIKTSLKTWSIGSILVPAFGSIIFIILSLFIH